jgi:hypothetical protein
LFDSFGHPPLEPARGVWEDDLLRLVKRTLWGKLNIPSASRMTATTTGSKTGTVGRRNFRYYSRVLIFVRDSCGILTAKRIEAAFV